MLYKLAFSRLKGMNVSMAQALLALVGSEKEFFEASASMLQMRCKLRGVLCSDEHRRHALDEAATELRWIEQNRGVHVIYFTDPDYPQRLLQCDDAPAALFTLGAANLNARHVIAVVGTRSCTAYGVDFINKLIDELAERLDDVLIISGLALGCDVTAHKRALERNIPTAAVVAHGLDTIYPAENRPVAARMVAKSGAIITDYPHGTRLNRGSFLARNRIVAGMSDCVVVAESAAERGGALHTARIAALYNRDVFALPGRTSDHYSGGCNKLIRNNVAHLCTCASDIIDIMGWKARPKEGHQQQLVLDFSPQQQAVIDYLQHNGEAQLNALIAATGMQAGQLMAQLVDLEFNGLVMALPGSRYRLA